MKESVALGSALLIFSGCSCERGKPVDPIPTASESRAAEEPELRALSAELGISLPPGTRVLLLERQAGMDDLVRAKLQMSRAAFEQLSPRLPVKDPDLRPGAGRLGTDHERWDPHATAGLRSGQAPLAGARYLTLGVADGGGEQVTLFVVNHGT